MPELEHSGYEDLDRLLTVVRRTRELLDRVVDDGSLPPGGADFIAQATLPHLEGVQAGFQGWLRSEAAGIAELRYLLGLVPAMRVSGPLDAAERRAELAEAERDRQALASGQRPIRGARGWDLALLGHARLVLATIPRLPDAAVRWPTGPRTYADIPVPRGPAELADRIEELERQLWRAATGRPSARTDPGFRRTYGFFDTADRLGWRAFGIAA